MLTFSRLQDVFVSGFFAQLSVLLHLQNLQMVLLPRRLRGNSYLSFSHQIFNTQNCSWYVQFYGCQYLCVATLVTWWSRLVSNLSRSTRYVLGSIRRAKKHGDFGESFIFGKCPKYFFFLPWMIRKKQDKPWSSILCVWLRKFYASSCLKLTRFPHKN